MKKLLPVFLLLVFACSQEQEEPAPAVPEVDFRTALDNLMKQKVGDSSIDLKSSLENLVDKYEGVGIEEDFTKVPKDILEEELKISQKVACEFTTTLIINWDSGCWIFVGEYGDGCGQYSGCISNSFMDCGNGPGPDTVYYC